MLAPSGELLRAGLGLKLNQVKRAAHSYMRDRTDQATGTITSYVVAAGLFAASGVFLIAALLVGLAALFRWVEQIYGRFPAFGVIGGLLLLIAVICAVVAAARLKRPSRQYPSLGSRLRVAIKSNPLKRDSIPKKAANKAGTDAMQDTAAALMVAPSPHRPATSQLKPPAQFKPMAQLGSVTKSLRDNRQVQAGLIVAATLLGWAAVRRKSQRQRMDA